MKCRLGWIGIRRLILFLGLFSLTPAQAIIGEQLDLSPFWTWKTVETEHFRITFPENSQDADMQAVAERAATYLEEAHTRLTQQLQWTPSRKTQVLVLDNQDTANGLAAAVGRLGLILYATPPDAWSSLAHYDDWFRLLCLHEYTHFVNMDTTTGLWQAGRVLFGDTMLPNSLWPTWMLEGLAVFNETLFTKGGRGRSPYWNTLLRTAVRENALDTEAYVSIDRLDGAFPHAPGGEIPYLFGYALMQRVGSKRLGEMSLRSGGRVPYFINGNVENITGKDWYATWSDWVEDSKKRATADLKRLERKPFTPTAAWSPPGLETLAPAVSPDGKTLAYTQFTADRRYMLKVRDLETGKETRVGDKLQGAGLAFSPDSRILIHSSLRRSSEWGVYSDLAYTDLKSMRTRWLTYRLRAKDPTLSRDGTRLVFTRTLTARTTLVSARVSWTKDGPQLSEYKTLWDPGIFSRLSNPVLSPDGRWIVVSHHDGKRLQEDLVRVDAQSGDRTVILKDGYFNRFPAFDSEGALYFASNRPGLETIYRLKGNQLARVVHTSGAARFPFALGDGLLVTHYTLKGWQIARVKEKDFAQFDAATEAALTVDPPAAPEPAEPLAAGSVNADFEVKPYSAFPSLLPRSWAPLIYSNGVSATVGGLVTGFDAVDRHRYLLVAGYDSTLRTFDFLANYVTRIAGPDLNFSVDQQNTSFTPSGSTIVAYTRRTRYQLGASFKFDWTWSALTPFVNANFEREALWSRSFGATDGPFSEVRKTRFIPNVDAGFRYNDTETSRLAVSAEAGRVSDFVTRRYFDSGRSVTKFAARHQEHFRLFGTNSHTILVPSLRGSMTSRTNAGFTASLVNTTGRYGRLVDSFDTDGADQMVIRGYPGKLFLSRSVGLASLDLRTPLVRLFHGWGTNPVFLNNLYGVVFGETARFYGSANSPERTLTSLGGGLRLTSTFFIRVPLVWAVEYHRGLQDRAGGRGEVFLSLSVPGLSF